METKVQHTRMPVELAKAIEREASEQMTNASTVVRQAVVKYLRINPQNLSARDEKLTEKRK